MAPEAGSGSEIDFLVHRVVFHIDNLMHVGPSRWLEYVWRKLRGRIMTVRADPAPVDPLLLSVERANRQAARRYRLRRYPGRVNVFLTGEREHLYNPHVRGQPGRAALFDPRMPGWVAGGGTVVHRIAGLHDNFSLEPHVGVLARKLRTCLDEVIPPKGGDPSPGGSTPQQSFGVGV